MSGTIVDNSNNTLMRQRPILKIGGSFITADQSVTRIVEERSKLQDDNTIAQVFIGDNHITYSATQDGRIEASDGQKEILLEIGDHINQQAVNEALDNVKKAESVLNPLGMEVVVRQASGASE